AAEPHLRALHHLRGQALHGRRELCLPPPGQVARNGRLHGKSASMMAADLQLFNIGWTARRSSIGDTETDFRQTSGPDMYVLQNWVGTSLANTLTRAPTEPVSREELARSEEH